MSNNEIPAQPSAGVSTEAAGRLQFYQEHYDLIWCEDLGVSSKPLILGKKPFRCRFCGECPPTRTFKRRAHAVSELLGNKLIRSLYECDQCNGRFKEFEDDLGKAALAIRNVGGVHGKGGVPTLVARSGKSRIEFTSERPVFKKLVNDDDLRIDESNGIIYFTYLQQPYRPLGAYKALCKAAFTLLPPEETSSFPELQNWLLQPDVMTFRVYGTGAHRCMTSFVPAFRPFPSSVVVVHRRKANAPVPYVSFFIAAGNVSYQIFPPCPARDGNRTLQIVQFPHSFDFLPWLAKGLITYDFLDWSSPEREGGPRTLQFRFGGMQRGPIWAP